MRKAFGPKEGTDLRKHKAKFHAEDSGGAGVKRRDDTQLERLG